MVAGLHPADVTVMTDDGSPVQRMTSADLQASMLPQAANINKSQPIQLQGV